MPEPSADLTLVLTGGGALAAYQVGFLRCLARRFPDLHIPIYTGVSAGAINAAYLANHGGTFAEAVDDLYRLWHDLTLEQVFHVDSWNLFKNLVGWGIDLVSGYHAGPHGVRGLVDTAPLRKLLVQGLTTGDGILLGLKQNLERGKVKALAITGTDYSTGQSVTWVQGRQISAWDRPQRRSVPAELTIDHVMASSALPLIFPAIKIDGEWFGDGGIRQAAPLSPALNLGARNILAISTHHVESLEAGGDSPPGHLPPAQIISTLLSAIFLDVLDRDARMLETINRLLARLPGGCCGDLHPVRLFILRPSRDLGRFAREFEAGLPPAFRFLGRRLGTHRTESPEWLSLVLFEPGYLHELMAIGEADAEKRRSEIEELIG